MTSPSPSSKSPFSCLRPSLPALRRPHAVREWLDILLSMPSIPTQATHTHTRLLSCTLSAPLEQRPPRLNDNVLVPFHVCVLVGSNTSIQALVVDSFGLDTRRPSSRRRRPSTRAARTLPQEHGGPSILFCILDCLYVLPQALLGFDADETSTRQVSALDAARGRGCGTRSRSRRGRTRAKYLHSKPHDRAAAARTRLAFHVQASAVLVSSLYFVFLISILPQALVDFDAETDLQRTLRANELDQETYVDALLAMHAMAARTHDMHRRVTSVGWRGRVAGGEDALAYLRDSSTSSSSRGAGDAAWVALVSTHGVRQPCWVSGEAEKTHCHLRHTPKLRLPGVALDAVTRPRRIYNEITPPFSRSNPSPPLPPYTVSTSMSASLPIHPFVFAYSARLRS
ncbi:hypothetical protein B0H12DRAFT_1231825 [Mycena haematopus]|nr:hypothetical protein B0H12DRAFT_1231825 [Mycena haematopus]